MEGTESRGCVAWDSCGKLILGPRVVHEHTLPRISVGDEVSVSLNHAGDVSFALNGQPVHHTAHLWPERELSYFLRNPSDPTARGNGVSGVRALLSFRNASLEVVGDVALRDE